PDFAARIARITGTWRIEIENLHPGRDGETIVAIAVGARGATAPAVHLVRAGSAETVELRRGNGRPIAISLSDTKESDRDIAACVTNRRAPRRQAHPRLAARPAAQPDAGHGL